MEDEEEADRRAKALAASQGQRRQGLPCRVLADRAGDLYSVGTRQFTRDTFAAVLLLRLNEMRREGLRFIEEELPHEACDRVRKAVMDAWMQEPQQRSVLQTVQSKCSTRDKYMREVRTRFRTAMFQRFGGYDWFLIFIALGDVSPETVAIFNDIVATRIQEAAQREATREPRDDARLSARSQAARQGQPLPEVQGLQHTPSQGHQLRSKAKMLQSKLQQHDQEWWREHNSGHWYNKRWYEQKHRDLQASVDDAWARATAAAQEAIAKEPSHTTKYNYKQRDGTYVKEESQALVTVVLKRWRQEVAPHLSQTPF